MSGNGLAVLRFNKDRRITVGDNVILEYKVVIRSTIVALQRDGRDATASRNRIIGHGNL